MAALESSGIADLTKISQAALLSSFLFHLTIGVREIYTDNDADIKDKMYGVNQIYHMVLPFIDFLVFGHKSSYKIDVLIHNLEEMGDSYKINHQIFVAWQAAQRSFALMNKDTL